VENIKTERPDCDFMGRSVHYPLWNTQTPGEPLGKVEIDKTDLLDKLQHKINLVSNYFTK
jgi:hypothetical protein